MIDKEFIPIILKLLPQIIENGSGEKSEKLLKEIGLCNEHIEEVFEYINHANGRIPLLNMGMKLSQFSGDFDDSPIFKEAIKLLIKEKE